MKIARIDNTNQYQKQTRPNFGKVTITDAGMDCLKRAMRWLPEEKQLPLYERLRDIMREQFFKQPEIIVDKVFLTIGAQINNKTFGVNYWNPLNWPAIFSDHSNVKAQIRVIERAAKYATTLQA